MDGEATYSSVMKPTNYWKTGGGLLNAKTLFTPGERFITCNVDILTDLDLGKLIEFHESNQSLFRLV